MAAVLSAWFSFVLPLIALVRDYFVLCARNCVHYVCSPICLHFIARSIVFAICLRITFIISWVCTCAECIYVFACCNWLFTLFSVWLFNLSPSLSFYRFRFVAFNLLAVFIIILNRKKWYIHNCGVSEWVCVFLFIGRLRPHVYCCFAWVCYEKLLDFVGNFSDSINKKLTFILSIA